MLLGTRYWFCCLDHRALTVKRNLFEMFLKNNGLKGNSKALCYNYFDLYIHFDRT